MGRRWVWVAGIMFAALVAAGAAAALGRARPAARVRLAAAAQALRAWAVAEVDDPLRRVGPLQGAALTPALPGGGTAAIWADRSGEGGRVRALAASLRDARPVLAEATWGCGPLEQGSLVLIPQRGPEVQVGAAWRCTPPRRSADGAISQSGRESTQLVDISLGSRDLGPFRAPALAAALAARDWPAVPVPALRVTPASCPPGCTLAVAGAGFLGRRATLRLQDDGGSAVLGTASVHDGGFRWTGRLPGGVPPGNLLVTDGAATAPFAALPAGAPGTVAAGRAAPVRPLPDARLPYPPDSPVPQPVTVAAGPGGTLWAGGQLCSGRPAACAGAAWVSSGGASWRQAFTDPGGAPVVAAAAGPGGAALLGDGRGLWRTVDGGAHWTAVRSPGPPPTVLAMAASDASRAWAAAGDGAWRSDDGGRTWTAVAPPCPVGASVVGLAFTSGAAGRAACAGEAGPNGTPLLVRVTDDGGAAWRDGARGTLTAMAAAPLAVAMAGSTLWADGVQVGPMAVPHLERSTDGGRTLASTLPPGVTGGSSLAAPAAGVALAAGRPVVLWPTAAGEALYGGPSAGAVLGAEAPAPGEPLALPSPDVGFAAGGAGAPGLLLRSGDGGSSWLVAHRFPDGQLRSVAFADEQHGFVVAAPTWASRSGGPCPPAPGGFGPRPFADLPGPSCLLRTTDGGASWALAAGPPDPAWVGAFAGGGALVVTGAGGVYAEGSSGWRAQGVLPPGATGPAPAQVSFGSEDFGAAAVPGPHPLLAVTQDGGRTWRIQPLPQGQQVLGLAATPGDGLWVLAQDCGGSGCGLLVLRSTDGGGAWTAQPLGRALGGDLPGRPPALAATSPDAAWLVVSGHAAYRTDDGGRIWTAA